MFSRYKDNDALRPDNQVAVFIRYIAKKKLADYRDERELRSYSRAMEDALERVVDLEKLVYALVEIFNTTNAEKDHKFLLYGYKNTLTEDQRMLFQQVVRMMRNAEK